MRAPTPTAAAEMAVPVRADLIAALDGMAARQSRAVAAAQGTRQQRLRDVARALPRLEVLLERPAQRFDVAVQRLGGALGMAAARKRAAFGAVAGRLRADILRGVLVRKGDALSGLRLEGAMARGTERRSAAFDKWASRLAPALARLLGDAARRGTEGRVKLAAQTARLDAASAQRFAALTARLDGLERMRLTLGYTETLARGYAVVRGDGAVISTRKALEAASAVEIEFADGRTVLGGKAKKPLTPPPSQGSLF
jgi:exodeoxyribonuclease VII large subunit